MSSSIFLAIALCAMQIAAQTTTTISMFLNMEDTLPSPIITASIVRADARATTYVANCDYTDDSVQCAMDDLTVTTGPSFQDFTSSSSNSFYRMSCTFPDIADGACEITLSADGSADSFTIDYATEPFPGFMPVLVTEGVEKLALGSSPTASSVDTSQTASSSRPSQAGASSTSGPAGNGSKRVLPCSLGYSALLVVLGILYL